jgi:hypothetical protein
VKAIIKPQYVDHIPKVRTAARQACGPPAAIGRCIVASAALLPLHAPAPASCTAVCIACCLLACSHIHAMQHCMTF